MMTTNDDVLIRLIIFIILTIISILICKTTDPKRVSAKCNVCMHLTALMLPMIGMIILLTTIATDTR